MEYTLEVLTIPVSDVERAKEFYADGLGFSVDVDYAPTPGFRVVQLTAPGSGCSIQLGVGLTDGRPGSVRNTHLVATDIEQARAELVENGVDVGAFEHKASGEDWDGDLVEGLDPERRDYATFFRLSDPDGNTWLIQERGHR